MSLLLLLLLAQTGQTQVCDGSAPAKCAPVSSSSGLKVDPSAVTQPIAGVVVVDGGYLDLVDRAGRVVGHVAVDSLPVLNDVIDGGSLSINNFPPVQAVSGSIAVNNLPRTLSGAIRTDSSGTLQPVTDAQVIALLALIASGVQQVQVANFPAVPLLRPNPFVPRCNPVVRTNCQP